MKVRPGLMLLALGLSLALARCATNQATQAAAPTSTHTYLPLVTRAAGTGTAARPPLRAMWQIQYTGELDTSLRVDLFNLDLFDTPPQVIEALKARGVFVMCYFSAGTWEDWRPDAALFPPEVLGEALADWPGERWLDVRRLDVLQPLMTARLDLARTKGCDGVDPDNVDGYANETGFPLTAEDQLAYNLWLAQAAHQRGLSIGLKNDVDQIPALVEAFDWALNESCFTYDECTRLLPFVEAGKPVFVIEYALAPADFCPQALAWDFNALAKRRVLDAYRVDCREWATPAP